MLGRVAVLALVGFFNVAACSILDTSISDDMALPKLQLGAFCQSEKPEQCASGLCASSYYAFCSKECKGDADCSGGLVCGMDADARRVCVYECPSESHPGFTCEKGGRVAVACGSDVTLCEECGCARGERCEIGVGCKSFVGDACETSSDCGGSSRERLQALCKDTVKGAVCRMRCTDYGDPGCSTYCLATENNELYCFVPQ